MSGDGAAGGPTNPPEAQTPMDERERRLAALRGLAQQEPAPAQPAAPAAASAAPSVTRTSRAPAVRRGRVDRPLWRQPRVWALATAALAVVIIGAVVVQVFGGLPGHPQVKRAPTPGIAIPALDELHCESSVAWAPDSRRVALVGYQQTCPELSRLAYSYFPGYLAIYDTQTGKSLAQINIDKPIQQALHLGAPVNATPINSIPQGTTDAQGIQYRDVAWSANGKRLAITFFLPDLSTTTNRNFYGVLLINPDGSSPRVLTQPVGSAIPQESPEALVWDLTTGAVLPAPVGSASQPDATFYSAGLGGPAQSWTWAGNGALVPQNPLLPLGDDVPPSPLAPIGNPSGGASFSIWQPGQIRYDFPPGATGQPDESVPGVPTFQNDFIAWSPDGRYLIDAAQLSVLLTPKGMPAPSVQTLEKLQLDNAVGLPVRDPAMQAVMKALAHPKANRGQASGTVAWSPDGKLLAVVAGESMPQQDEDYAIVTINILNCATGKTLATLKAHAAVNQTGIGGNEYMAWSPDSKHLFYFTDQLGSLTTWGPGLLPQG